MSRRVGLLAGLLVLVLGSGVVAQEPKPSPLFASDDLALTIPSRVGDYELHLVEWDDIDPDSREVWRDLLLPLGKEPADVRQVTSRAYPIGHPAGESAPAFTLDAMRVTGVPARDWTEQLMRVSHEAAGSQSAILQSAWHNVDGRDVYSATLAPPDVLEQVAINVAAERDIILTLEELAEIRAYEPPHPDLGSHLYPKGEVMYSINVLASEFAEDAPSLAEILAELP